MAIDKAVDSTQLDADLTSVANAIRTKGGTSASLAFPAGFVSAIGDIPTGGGYEQRFLIRNGVIQDGFIFSAYSPAVISEDAGGYVSVSVVGNEYCDAYANNISFSGFDYLITEFYPVNGVVGWSWNGDSINSKYPSINAGNGNAPVVRAANSHFDMISSSPGTSGYDISTECSIVNVSTLTNGNIKICVSGNKNHQSAYLYIKNMYLLGVP